MTVIYIYGLIDPRDNRVRYIGKTNNLKLRLKQHFHETKLTLKANWIKSLKKQKLKPSIQIIDVATELDWKTKEQYWISMFPDLLNMTSGGEGNSDKFCRLRGQFHSNSKLSEFQVLKIIELYKYTNLSSFDLCKIFNVKQITINCIIGGKSWKHLTNGVKTESCFKKKNPNKNGKQNGNFRGSKLSIKDVLDIKEMLNNNVKNVNIAKIYGVTPLTISKIKNNKSWRHIDN